MRRSKRCACVSRLIRLLWNGVFVCVVNGRMFSATPPFCHVSGLHGSADQLLRMLVNTISMPERNGLIQTPVHRNVLPAILANYKDAFDS